MATIADMLRQLGTQAAPHGGNALVGPITLPAYESSPLPLAVPPALARGWSRATGRPTEAHHALALAAARAGEGLALMGHGAVPQDDLLLIALSRLLAAPQTAALWVAPNERALEATVALLKRLDPALSWQLVGEPLQRGARAQLTLLTYDDLHRRVLQWSDRAWRWLWPQLRILALPALHQATGATGGHVLWLVRRVERLAGPVQLLTAFAPMAGAAGALPRLVGHSMRLIAASTGPTMPTLVALWHTAPDREGTLDRLVAALVRHHLALTVLGRDARETAALRAHFPPEVMVGAGADRARVALVAGVPPHDEERARLLLAGYRLVLLLAGDTPHERLLLAQPALLAQSLPAWPLPRGNPQINAAELLCAASERPLAATEVAEWQVGEQVQRLAEQGQLQELELEGVWQPAASGSDPYERIDPQTVRGQSVAVLTGGDELYDTVTPALGERWGHVGAVWSPGLLVESAGQGEIRLAPVDEEQATWPVEEVRVVIRDELATRSLQWKDRHLELRRLAVQVSARVRGLIELRPGQRPNERPVARAAERQWKAVALALTAELAPGHSAPGWSLATTLPLIAQAHPGTILPWYDRAERQLLLIEVDPGGVGLVEALYTQMERWLELAEQLAQACAEHSLYAPFAVPELQWIEGLPLKQPARVSFAPAVAEPAQPWRQPATTRPGAPQAVGTSAPPSAPAEAGMPTLSPRSGVKVPEPVELPLGRGVNAAAPTTLPSAQDLLATEIAAEASERVDVPLAAAPQPEPEPVGRAAVPLAAVPQPEPEPAERAAVPLAATSQPEPVGGATGSFPATRRPRPEPIQAPPAPVAPHVPAPESGVRPAFPRPAPVVSPRPVPPARPLVRTYAVPAPLPAAVRPAASLPAAEGSEAAIDSLAPDVGAAVQIALPVAEPDVPRHIASEPPVDDVGWSTDGSVDGDEEVDDISWEPDVREPLPFPAPARPAVNDRDPLRRTTPPRYPVARPARQIPRPVAGQRSVSGIDTTAREARAARPASSPRSGEQRPVQPPAPDRRPGPQPAMVPPHQTPPLRPAPVARQEAQPGNLNGGHDPYTTPQTPVVRREAQPGNGPAAQAAERPGDVGDMIARLRQLRSSRAPEPDQATPVRGAASPSEHQGEPRFQPGEHVQCLPYGEGRVVDSSVSGGRELLRVDFGEDGIIEVDPVVSLVRVVVRPEPANEEEPAD